MVDLDIKVNIVNKYYDKINDLIFDTKRKVIKNINYEMVDLYYKIGKNN